MSNAIEISSINKTHLSRKEAASLLCIASETLAKWATLKRGPRYIKMGNGRSCRVLYPLRDLQEFLSSQNHSGERQAT